MVQTSKSDLGYVRQIITDWLAEQGKRPADLCRICGLPPYTISRFLNGKVDSVDVMTAARLYAALAHQLTPEQQETFIRSAGVATLMQAVDQTVADALVAGADATNQADLTLAREMIQRWMRENKISNNELARRASVDASRVSHFFRSVVEAKTAARLYAVVAPSLSVDERRVLLYAMGLHHIALAMRSSAGQI